MDLSEKTVGFIGGGNMARAIGATLVNKGILKASNVWVSARTERTLDFWDNLGVHTTVNNNVLIANCATIILAVKPQYLESVMNNLRSTDEPKLFISVMVGVSTSRLEDALRPNIHRCRVIRTLPNTPSAVGAGITVYCCDHESYIPPDDEGYELVEAIFSSIGVVERIDESLMNAVSALSGSGPAFAYLMTEALADGAVKNGIPRLLATKLAAHMLVGAGKMVLETGKHPGLLKDEVCSPGGTTIAGVHALEAGGVRVSLMNAIDAAVSRANELSK